MMFTPGFDIISKYPCNQPHYPVDYRYIVSDMCMCYVDAAHSSLAMEAESIRFFYIWSQSSHSIILSNKNKYIKLIVTLVIITNMYKKIYKFQWIYKCRVNKASLKTISYT